TQHLAHLRGWRRFAAASENQCRNARRRLRSRWWLLPDRENLSRRKLERRHAFPAHRTGLESESRRLPDRRQRRRGEINEGRLRLLPESRRQNRYVEIEQQAQLRRRMGNHLEAGR